MSSFSFYGNCMITPDMSTKSCPSLLLGGLGSVGIPCGEYGLPKSKRVRLSIGLPVYIWVGAWTSNFFELPGVCQGWPYPMLSREFHCFRLVLCLGAGDSEGYRFIYAMSISFQTGNATAEGSMGCCPKLFCCHFCEGLQFFMARGGQLMLDTPLFFFLFFFFIQ